MQISGAWVLRRYRARLWFVIVVGLASAWWLWDSSNKIAAVHDPPNVVGRAPDVEWVIPINRSYDDLVPKLSSSTLELLLGVRSCHNPIRVIAELDLPGDYSRNTLAKANARFSRSASTYFGVNDPSARNFRVFLGEGFSLNAGNLCLTTVFHNGYGIAEVEINHRIALHETAIARTLHDFLPELEFHSDLQRIGCTRFRRSTSVLRSAGCGREPTERVT
jgi:hypothetical protein